MKERATLEHPDKEMKETTPLSPIEFLPQVHHTKTTSKVKHQEVQKQTMSPIKWGDKKEHAIKRNGRLPSKRAKCNGGKQTIRYRRYRMAIKILKELTDNYKEPSENYNSMKKKIKTININ